MEFLILESYDEGKNRRRRYLIQVSAQDGAWSIQMKWGRIGESLQHKTEQAPDEKKLHSRLQSILRMRLRHGYYLCEQSKAFPEISALGMLGEERIGATRQLSLFAVSAK